MGEILAKNLSLDKLLIGKIPFLSFVIDIKNDVEENRRITYNQIYENKRDKTFEAYLKKPDIDISILEKERNLLADKFIDESIVLQIRYDERNNIGSIYTPLKDRIPLSTSQREKLHEASYKSEVELIEQHAETYGELHGMDKFLGIAKWSGQFERNNDQTQTKVAKDTQTPLTALEPKPAIKLTDASGPANLAKVIKNEAIPAMESLQTSQAASSLALENNQINVEAVSDAYSGYSNALMGAADSMSYLALTEETIAQKQSVTTGILSNALNEAQTKVDSLVGDSLVQLSNAFAGAIVNGQNFGEALKSMGENILYTIIQMQALSWITSLFGFGSSSGMGKFGTFTPSDSILNLGSSSPYGAWGSVISAIFSAKGNVFGPQGLKAFAKGGIISKPTLFGFAKGIGLMGEAGAEAIMPLGRDSRGNLGVRVADSAMSGVGTSGVFAPHVEINVENKGGGDMSEEQARTLGAQVKAIVEMQVAKQMYEYMRNGTLRPSMGRGY